MGILEKWAELAAHVLSLYGLGRFLVGNQLDVRSAHDKEVKSSSRVLEKRRLRRGWARCFSAVRFWRQSHCESFRLQACLHSCKAKSLTFWATAKDGSQSLPMPAPQRVPQNISESSGVGVPDVVCSWRAFAHGMRAGDSGIQSAKQA